MVTSITNIHSPPKKNLSFSNCIDFKPKRVKDGKATHLSFSEEENR